MKKTTKRVIITALLLIMIGICLIAGGIITGGAADGFRFRIDENGIDFDFDSDEHGIDFDLNLDNHGVDFDLDFDDAVNI